MSYTTKRSGLSVPSSRISRLARLGGLGAGVAGSVVANGARRLARGDKPKLENLLLTPTNIARVTEELSRLRGAAMKLGQLMSMDGGEIIAPELAQILSQLRSSAYAMPPAQLKKVLDRNWGRDWLKKFERFDVRPIATASIGQVHRAKTRDGRDLAIKVQYPGVRESIDSDVDNVAMLVRVARLIPENVDITPILLEAKKQLRDEADYEREAENLETFSSLLSGSNEFALPSVHRDLTSKNVLAMTYMNGKPIESLTPASQSQRNHVVGTLMKLVLRELFEFRLMQTDPNFANFWIDDRDQRIVLLDFGAAREIPELLSNGYRALLSAGIREDWSEVFETLNRMGLIGEQTEPEHLNLIQEVMSLATEPMRSENAFDFGQSDLALRLRDKGMALRGGGFVHVPPPVTLFLHRKIGGTYLLATNLKAQVNVAALVRPFLAS